MMPRPNSRSLSWPVLSSLLLLIALVLAGGAAAQTDPFPELAFVANGNIYWGARDGLGFSYVTNDDNDEQRPVVSPDGQTIVFVRQFTYDFATSVQRDSELMRINADGAGLQELTRNDLVESWPAWSPDGTRLAFAAGHVYVMPITAAGGGAPVQLTTGVSNPQNLIWSPDGSWLAFNAWPSGEDEQPNSADMELYVLPVAGGDLTRLTTNELYDGDPTWSPDGERLAYEVGQPYEGESHIYLINTSGGPATPLVTAGNGADPAWSPDGARIAFVGAGPAIAVIHPDGSGRQTFADRRQSLAAAGSTWQVFDPTWTSDSRYVIYADTYEGCGMMCYSEVYVKRWEPDSGQSDTLLEDNGYSISWLRPTAWSAVEDRLAYIGPDHTHLYTRDISTTPPGEIRQLTFRESLNGDPAWSPDGLFLAYSSRRANNYDIHVSYIGSLSRARRVLTTHPGNDWNPSWSIGNQIAFTSNRDGNWELYVMNADGSGQTNLTQTPAMPESDAAWSPDGARLAFAREMSGNWDIYVMNGDGSGVTRLTSHAADDRYPAWSPDGTRLAFQSERDGNEEIYILIVAGPPGNEANWTRHPDEQREPTWSPDGTRIAFNQVASTSADPHVGGEIVIKPLSGGQLLGFSEAGPHAQPAWRPDVPDLTPQAWVPMVRK